MIDSPAIELCDLLDPVVPNLEAGIRRVGVAVRRTRGRAPRHHDHAAVDLLWLLIADLGPGDGAGHGKVRREGWRRRWLPGRRRRRRENQARLVLLELGRQGRARGRDHLLHQNLLPVVAGYGGSRGAVSADLPTWHPASTLR